MTNKSAKGSSVPVAPLAVPGIASPPDVATLLAAPSGYVPRPPGSFAERTLMQTQKRAAFDAVGEVRHAEDYGSIFGQIAPDREDLVNALGVAGGWSIAIQQMSEWLVYAKDQEKNAWLHALPLLDAMKPPLESAVARRPELGSRFAALVRFYGLSHARGQNAARGREKAKAKKAAANDAASKSSESASSADAATPAPSAEGAHNT